MIILVVFICLFAERFLYSLHVLRSFKWLEIYANFILKYFSAIHWRKGKIPVLMIVLLPVVIVGLIDRQLSQLFFPLSFIFSIVILLYSFGPQTFYDRSKALCQANNSNDNACANWYAEKILDRQLDHIEQENLPHIIAQNLFPISNDRIFAPIFWFVLLGPMGAILFRCSSQLYFITKKQENTQYRYKRIAYSADFLYAVLNWMPCRLSAFGFAAMGNFSGAMKNYSTLKKSHFTFNHDNNQSLLCAIGSGAINLPMKASLTTPNKINETLAILRRNMQLWMGSIAILTLAGWII